MTRIQRGWAVAAALAGALLACVIGLLIVGAVPHAPVVVLIFLVSSLVVFAIHGARRP